MTNKVDMMTVADEGPLLVSGLLLFAFGCSIAEDMIALEKKSSVPCSASVYDSLSMPETNSCEMSMKEIPMANPSNSIRIETATEEGKTSGCAARM